MFDLTDRQKSLLKLIIEQYINTAEAVGSEVIDREHNLGVSPATIRIEMSKLTDMGYLRQPHTSAGRIPTAAGMRLYIHELMKEKQLPVAAEVSIKEKLWHQRFKQERLLKEAVKALAQRCGMLGLATAPDDQLYYAGASNILDWPEFYDIDVAKFVLALFDGEPLLQQILNKAQGTDSMHILFGEDMEYESLRPTGFVFTNYEFGPDNVGIIGVIGPSRMNYAVVLPYVKYVRDMIVQAAQV